MRARAGTHGSPGAKEGGGRTGTITRPPFPSPIFIFIPTPGTQFHGAHLSLSTGTPISTPILPSYK